MIKTLLRLPQCSGQREKGGQRPSSLHLPQDRVEQSPCIQGQSKATPPSPPPIAQRRKGRQRARNAPGEMRAESGQIILPFPWKPGLAEVSVCANEALAGVWGGGWGAGRTREPDAETLRLAEAEDKRGWRAGSFSRNPSYSWPASQLLERCVCGLKNGAIVSTRPPPACRDPSACSSTALQRGSILSLPPRLPS